MRIQVGSLYSCYYKRNLWVSLVDLCFGDDSIENLEYLYLVSLLIVQKLMVTMVVMITWYNRLNDNHWIMKSKVQITSMACL